MAAIDDQRTRAAVTPAAQAQAASVPPAVQRRRRRLAALALVVGLPAAWGLWWEPASLTARSADLPLPHWPRALDGMRVAVVSDLHVGAPYVGLRKLRDVVAAVNAARSDVVVLLGDFVVGNRRTGAEPGARFVEPELIADELRGLRAPLGPPPLRHRRRRDQRTAGPLPGAARGCRADPPRSAVRQAPRHLGPCSSASIDRCPSPELRLVDHLDAERLGLLGLAAGVLADHHEGGLLGHAAGDAGAGGLGGGNRAFA